MGPSRLWIGTLANIVRCMLVDNCRSTMHAEHEPRPNHLIAVLPPTEFERLRPGLELVKLPLGSALYVSGSLLRHAFFPTTAIASLLYVMENGASAEVAVVGREGVMGVAVFLGGQTVPNRTIVQSAGYAWRIERQALMNEFERAGRRRPGSGRSRRPCCRRCRRSCPRRAPCTAEWPPRGRARSH